MTETSLLTKERIVDPLKPFVLDDHRLMLGDMVLDLAMRTVHSRSAKSVKLSGNEFVILATLIKTPGRFVSKKDLLIAVTGSEHGAHHSVIDTYIKFLHRRLQEADTSATIEKATGIGFRLHP